MMMHERSVDLSLVVPVYHCAGSLDATLAELERFLDSAPISTELLLVDDCGTDPGASAQLREYARRPDVRYLENDRNHGKGFSVRRGMLAARGRHRIFTDADLAYPLSEIWKITDELERGAQVVVACRVLGDSQYVVRSSHLRYFYTRHVMSRAFNRLVRMTLLPGILDTQAGLKGFTAPAAREIFSRVGIDGFGFDVECLYLARRMQLEVRQVPVRFRYDDEPSTVRFFRDAGTMAADLVRIRWQALTGTYDARPAAPELVPTPSPTPGPEASIFQA